jgi:hypothetical protein
MITKSLLKSAMMVDTNMLFPDLKIYLCPPPPMVKIIGLGPPTPMVKSVSDIDTGKIYHSAHGELCTKPNQ